MPRGRKGHPLCCAPHAAAPVGPLCLGTWNWALSDAVRPLPCWDARGWASLTSRPRARASASGVCTAWPLSYEPPSRASPDAWGSSHLSLGRKGNACRPALTPSFPQDRSRLSYANHIHSRGGDFLITEIFQVMKEGQSLSAWLQFATPDEIMGLGTKHQQFLNSEEEQQKGLVVEGPR